MLLVLVATALLTWQPTEAQVITSHLNLKSVQLNAAYKSNCIFFCLHYNVLKSWLYLVMILEQKQVCKLDTQLYFTHYNSCMYVFQIL